jgi:ABC-2 type transport system ATP-binding protein
MMAALLNPSIDSCLPGVQPSALPAALCVSGLSHSYGPRKALKDVSISVQASTFAVLLGLNGAGKSTLFSLITRLFNSQTGEIRIFGHDLRRQPAAALAMLGVVFQARTLDMDLSVMQNLLYHAALHGISGTDARTRGTKLLKQMTLQDRSREKVRDLSGGQMRRVEIARALLHEPRLLLLDEPTVGLDVEARAGILQHVRSLTGNGGVSALWATHLIDEVAETDTVIVLHRGEVLAHGIAADVVRFAGARDISEAFALLTRAAPPSPAD